MTTYPLQQTNPSNPLAPILNNAPNELQARLAEFIKYAQHSRSKNTQEAMVRDIRIFREWCHAVGKPWLPAQPETIAAFAIAMMETRKTATIKRYVASISTVHKWAIGEEGANPASHVKVQEALKIVGRTLGRRQKQATPINADLRGRMIQGALKSGKPWGKRDAAMLAVAYDTLARRAEVLAIKVEDITLHEDGSGTVLLRKTKTDQEGEGATRYLANDTVEYLQAWLEEARIQEGAIFCSVNRWGHVSENAMSLRAANKAFRRLAETVGADPEGIGGHSARVGMAQDMVEKGLGTAEIMQAGGWKTSTMVARYSEKQQAKKGAAAKMAILQNR